MEKIPAGAVVKLKSGGPKMTVLFFYQGPKVECGWFVVNEFRTGMFSSESLEIIK